MPGFPHLSDTLPQLALPSEVAEFLGEHTRTVQHLLRKGDLPGVKVGGRWYVHVARLREQLSGVRPPQSVPAPVHDATPTDIPPVGSDVAGIDRAGLGAGGDQRPEDQS
jgi:excisionase family DNA binding protein